eukprot:240134-Heterocapsa_arctica.AAC.1
MALRSWTRRPCSTPWWVQCRPTSATLLCWRCLRTTGYAGMQTALRGACRWRVNGWLRSAGSHGTGCLLCCLGSQPGS